MANRIYLAYNLYRLSSRYEFLSTRWELIDSIDAEKENVKNYFEAVDYFKSKMYNVESDAYVQESIDNVKREGAQIGYLVTFNYKRDPISTPIEPDFSDSQQDSDDF
jgi:hypothetical protein